MQYHISAEVQAHKEAVRALDTRIVDGKAIIATGGLDGVVLSWKIEPVADIETASSPLSIVRDAELARHGVPVYSIVIHSENDAIYSGSQKGSIIESGRNGVLQGHFHGHSQPVNALSVWLPNRLVSGCWDATARVWITETRACSAILSGPHTYAVTVCPMDEQRLLTGSQNGKMIVWEGNMPVQEIAAHSDIIRAIAPIIGWPGAFLTCSNDGLVRFWKAEDGRLQPWTIETAGVSTAWAPGGANDVMLFDVRGYKVEDGPLIVASAADDGTLRQASFLIVEGGLTLITDEVVWTHISSVWAVRFLASSAGDEEVKAYPDILTACGDGSLRLFTTDTERAMKESAAESLRAQSLATVMAARKSEGAMDISKLPKISERASMRGRVAGQTKLFVNGVVVEVHQWTGSEWQKMGDMVAPPDGSDDTMSASTQLYEGDDFFPAGQYDFVFHVEIESNSSHSKLPFRRGENPMEVAERFCARERIGKHNVPDILKFIEVNAGVRSSHSAPIQTTVNPPVQHLPSPADPVPRPPNAHSALQTMMPTTFPAGAKWEKPIEMIIDLNKNQREELKLKTYEIPNLMTLRTCLEQPGFDNEKIGSRDLHMLLCPHLWNQWEPKTSLFPWFDIMRKVASNQTAADFFRRNVRGRENITFVLEFASAVDGLNSASPVPMLIFRYLTNVSSWVSTRDFFVQDVPYIVELLRLHITPLGQKYDLATPTQRNALAALLHFLTNVAIGINANGRSTLAKSSASARAALKKSIESMVEYVHDISVTEHGCVKQGGDVNLLAVCLVITAIMMCTLLPGETSSAPRVTGLAREVERCVTPLLSSPTVLQAEAIKVIKAADQP